MNEENEILTFTASEYPEEIIKGMEDAGYCVAELGYNSKTGKHIITLAKKED